MKLAFVTSNKHKLEEAAKIMKLYGIELYMVPAAKSEVQASRLEDVALLAARYAYEELRKPLIVEDAGLFIDALKGFPGPYSSFVFKTVGVNGILKLMNGVDDRRARFKAAVAYIDGNCEVVFTGEVEGTITLEPRGTKGFGFDPIFVPLGEKRTFAEMSVDEKNRYSHRAKALRKLGSWLQRKIKECSQYQ